MRDFWREISTALKRHLTPAARVLFVTNVLVFIPFALLIPLSGTVRFLFNLLVQRPSDVVHHFFLWQLVTYMFLHTGAFHLLCNMLILWFFGPRLEYRWGSARFLRFYLIVGVGAGLFHLVLAFLMKNPQIALIGASGALYGLLMAWALYWPNDDIYLFGLYRIKVKHAVILFALVEFFGTTTNAYSPISHITHLGGLVVALVYIKGPDWFRRMRARTGGGGPRRRGRVIQVDPRRHPDFR